MLASDGCVRLREGSRLDFEDVGRRAFYISYRADDGQGLTSEPETLRVEVTDINDAALLSVRVEELDRADGLRPPGGTGWIVVEGLDMGRTDGSDEYELAYGPYLAEGCVAQNRSCETNPAAASPSASNCAVRCRAVAGVGAGLRVHLRVLPEGAPMLGNDDLSVSYRPPLVESVTGRGATQSATGGGDPIVVNGANFGAPPAPDLRVVYGLQGGDMWRYEALGCEVVSDSTISCRSAEGGGKALELAVLGIGGQDSELDAIVCVCAEEGAR